MNVEWGYTAKEGARVARMVEMTTCDHCNGRSEVMDPTMLTGDETVCLACAESIREEFHTRGNCDPDCEVCLPTTTRGTDPCSINSPTPGSTRGKRSPT